MLYCQECDARDRVKFMTICIVAMQIFCCRLWDEPTTVWCKQATVIIIMGACTCLLYDHRPGLQGVATMVGFTTPQVSFYNTPNHATHTRLDMVFSEKASNGMNESSLAKASYTSPALWAIVHDRSKLQKHHFPADWAYVLPPLRGAVKT